MPNRFARLSLLLPLLAATGPADRLPLARGMYVDADTPCENAPSVSILSYRGGGFAPNESHGLCRITALRRAGAVFTVSSHCSGPQLSSNEVKKITVVDRHTFLYADASPPDPRGLVPMPGQSGAALESYVAHYRWCGNPAGF